MALLNDSRSQSLTATDPGGARKRRRRLLPFLVLTVCAVTSLGILRLGSEAPAQARLADSQDGAPVPPEITPPEPQEIPLTDQRQTPANDAPEQELSNQGQPSGLEEDTPRQADPETVDSTNEDPGLADQTDENRVVPVGLIVDPTTEQLPLPVQPIPDDPPSMDTPAEEAPPQPDEMEQPLPETEDMADDRRPPRLPIPVPLPLPTRVPLPPLPIPTPQPPPIILTAPPLPPTVPIPVPVTTPEPVPRPHPNGAFFVQILATPHEDSICAIWDQLKADLPDLFEYAERSITRIETTDKQVLFRLRVGAFLERSEAVRFCTLLEKEGHDCFVARRGSNADGAPP